MDKGFVGKGTVERAGSGNTKDTLMAKHDPPSPDKARQGGTPLWRLALEILLITVLVYFLL